ncbi:hypothetical protein BBP40_012412 [Aspergillus hancockii]|nr:hypothetical protein BBP40_012412 [Aspergillus hancockii]
MPGWRPATLRGRYLAVLTGLLLAMFVTIEGIRMGSEARGGLAVFSSDEDISVSRQVAYTFVPMILGVLVGVMWSFTEYDALRLEPYFLLSGPEGSSADVLLLNYVFGHFTTTPFRAARNRHWVAFCVSILSIALQLVLPVVLGRLINAEVVSLPIKQTFKTWPELINLDKYGYWAFHDISNQTRFNTNTHMTFGPVESRKYGIPPVQIPWNTGSEEDTWMLNQSVYWTDVSCTYLNGGGVFPDISLLELDGKWPSMTELLHSDQDNGQITNASRALETCTVRPDRDIFKMGPRILRWKLLESSRDAKLCGQFNLLGVTVNANNTYKPHILRPSSHESSHWLSPFGCSVSYKTAEAELTIMDFQSAYPMARTLSEEEVWSEVDRTLNQAFVPLLSRVFNLKKTAYVQGFRITQVVALIVDSSSARISSSILAFGTVVVASLLYLYPRRENFLSGNPASIASMCCITTDIIDGTSLAHLSNMGLEAMSTRRLRAVLRKCSCTWQETDQGKRLVISPPNEPVPERRIPQRFRLRGDPPPPFLIIPFFTVEILALFAALGGIGVILVKSWKDGYFPPLTDIKVDDLKSLWMLLPPAGAAIMRGLYISLYQNLTILEPWFILQKGKATARSSLILHYGSQSPFAVALKCLNRRHLLLGLVALTCILNTILTVLASALFALEYAPVATAGVVKSDYDHQSFIPSNHTSILAEADLFQSSIYTDTSMLPWTTPTLSMLPVQANMTEDQWASSPLVAISAGLNCWELSVADSRSEDTASGTTYWQYSPSDDDSTTCRISAQESVLSHWNRSFAVDFIAPTESDQNDEACQKPGILVIAQTNDTTLATDPSGNCKVLYCVSIPEIQNFTSVFDRRGYVEDYDPINGTSITNGPMFDNVTISLANYNRVFSNPLQANVTDETPNRRHKVLQNWFGILAAHVYRQKNTNNLTAINADLLIEAATLVYQTVFATDVTLHQDYHFKRVVTPEPILDAAIYDTYMSFVPVLPGFIVVFLIIAFDAYVLLYVFITRRGRLSFPRSPRSIGSMMPWVAKSRMLDDFRGTSAWNEAERAEHLVKLDKRYALKRTDLNDGKWTYALDEELGSSGEVAPLPDIPPKESVTQSTAVDR